MEPLPQPRAAAPESHSRAPSWLGRWQSLSPLARDIIVILVVKALVLYAIWFAFFRTPVARHMTMDPTAVELKVAGPRLDPEKADAIR